MAANSNLLVAQAIASTVKTLLGPSKSIKCIVNSDGDEILSRSTAELLQCLDSQHPAGFIINDSCQAMYKTYGTGCTTLVCMIGCLSRAAEELLTQGIAVPVISKLYAEALTVCRDVAQKIAIPLGDLLHTNHPSYKCDDEWKSNVHNEIRNNFCTEHNAANLQMEDMSPSVEKRNSESIEVSSQITSQNCDYTQGTNKFALENTLTMTVPCQNILKKSGCASHNVTDFENNVTSSNTMERCKTPTEKAGCSSQEAQNEKEITNDEFDNCFDNAPDPPNKDLKGKTSTSTPEKDLESANHIRHPRENRFCTSSKKQELKATEKLLEYLSLSRTQNSASSDIGTVQRKNVSRSSRHLFCEGTREGIVPTHHVPSAETFLSSIVQRESLENLGNMLAGEESKECWLATEVAYSQLMFSMKLDDLKLYPDLLHVEAVIGPLSCRSEVIDGILIRQAPRYCPTYPQGEVRVALVNGDITEQFRHVGFKDSFQAKWQVSDASDLFARTANRVTWVDRVSQVIKSLRIGTLFAKGEVEQSVFEFCDGRGITVFQHVPFNVLRLLSSALGISTVVYLLDLQEDDIGKGLTITRYYLNEVFKSTSSFAVVKTTPVSKIPLKTVLLSAPTKSLLADSEFKFRRSFNRLRNALSCNKVLPGGCQTEVACITALEQFTGNVAPSPGTPLRHWLHCSLDINRPAVYAGFASALRDFLSRVVMNSGRTPHESMAMIDERVKGFHQSNASTHPLIADDYTAKLEAWRRAVDVVRLLLQTDSCVVTGIQDATVTDL